jgi:small subunit ribosomal protein S5
MLKEIEKEITKADIGIMPNNDGKVIRLAFPELNEERRKELVKNVKKIDIVDNRTISHDIIGEAGAAKVLLKPAPAGTGIIAGGPVRTVLELAGLKDVVSKSLGSNTKINTSKATMKALTSQRSAETIAKLRGKTVEEILG